MAWVITTIGDHRGGNSRVKVRGRRHSYGPYGEPNAIPGIRFRYTGQYFLGEIGLHYYKARFYSPTLGRFLQTDPVGYQSDLNLYAYVGNDPVNNIDPDGNFPQFLVIPAIGGAINALSQGYEASQSGASAYGIAAAAGKGFISGFAGTAAGLVTGAASPALSAAVGGAVENVVNLGLNGKIPGSLPELKDAAISTGLAAAGAAVLGKGVEKLLPTIKLNPPADVYKASASYSLAPQNAQNIPTPAQIATRQVDQTIGSGLGGGSVQAVSGLVGRALGKP